MGLRDVGQQFFEKESRVVVIDRVVLDAAVHPIQRVTRRRLHPSMHDEHADHRRHVFLVNQIVEDDRGVVLEAVLEHHDGRRLCPIELPGNVNPVFAPCARINRAPIELSLDDLTGRGAGLHLRVRPCRRLGGRTLQGRQAEVW